VDLIVETETLTPAAIAALLAAREQPELICDRCVDPHAEVVAIMQIDAIEQTFALCGPCTSELPRGYQEV